MVVIWVVMAAVVGISGKDILMEAFMRPKAV